jgi:hypothetical protein
MKTPLLLALLASFNHACFGTEDLRLTGYAFVGSTPFACLVHPTSGKTYFVSTSPDIFNNQLLEFHALDSSITSVRGKVRLGNQTHSFSGGAKDRRSSQEPPSDLGQILIYPSLETSLIWYAPYFIQTPESQGLRDGKLAALQTLVLLEILEMDDAQTLLHYRYNPLPVNPTPEMIGQGLPIWKNSNVPLSPKIHETYDQDSQLDAYYTHFQTGWKNAFSIP